MLPLTDPLWEKLDSGFNDRQDVPRLLLELAEAWDKDKAILFFRDALFDEGKGTCYGATYAAVPHLLKLAEADGNCEQRGEIALFLGFITLCALERESEGPLPGLPEDLEGWDRKLDGYRSCVAAYQDPSRPIDASEQRLLPPYKEILAIDPVNAADLEKIKSIRVEFLSSLPRISALCERALLERIEDDLGREMYLLLSGIAAAEGLLGLSTLLNYGTDGWLRCAACDWNYQYWPYGERIAIYADPQTDPRSGYDRAHLDFVEDAPSRADGFIIPAARDDVSDPRALRLLSLADRLPSPEPGLLLRSFLGHIQCCKCGTRAAIRDGRLGGYGER
jgi:hypothetical protein